MEPGKDYSIEIDNLKTDSHRGYEVVEDAIESLMRTILTIKEPNGSKTRVQFLGGNNLDNPERPAGVFTYSFDKKLIKILQEFHGVGKNQRPRADGLHVEILGQPVREHRSDGQS